VVVYRQGQAELYGVFHHIFLSQSLLDYTLEALQGLSAVAFLFVHQELLRRRWRFSQYYCDAPKRFSPVFPPFSKKNQWSEKT